MNTMQPHKNEKYENIDFKELARKYIFAWPLALVLIVFSLYLRAVDDTLCTFMFGYSLALLGLFEISYLLPLLFFIITLYVAKNSYKELTEDYSSLEDDIDVTQDNPGAYGKVRAVILLFTPLLVIYMAIHGHLGFTELRKGQSMEEMNISIQDKCENTWKNQ